MRIERTIAAAVLALGLSALLYAQSPGLFSTLEVDGDATFYASGIIDDHNLHTATGSSTGTGERSIAYQALSFVPALSGDVVCSVFGSPGGWTIRTSVSARWGEFLLPTASASYAGIAVSGSNLWVVNNRNPDSVWRLSQSDPSTGTEFLLPSGVSNPTGITASGSNLWVVDTTFPDSVWRLSQSDPSTGTEFLLPSGFGEATGIAASGSNLWVADRELPVSVWRVSQSDPSTGTEFLLPSGVGTPTGIAASGSNLWVADRELPVSVWRVSQSDPSTGTEFALPSGLLDPSGVTAAGSDLWVLDKQPDMSVWRVPQSNPAAMDCGGTADTNTLEWTYVTGSDDPAVWARRTAAGEVVELWQAEDAPAAPPIGIPPWQTTTDTVVMPGPPPTATLTAIYAAADADDQAAALQALSAYVSTRGWLSGVSAVGDIANVPESGCGAPGGDCEPAARLHALRALAAAVHPDAPDAVFELVSGSLRVDAAGGWSVTP